MKKIFSKLLLLTLITSMASATVYSDGTNPEDWKIYSKVKGEITSKNGVIDLSGNGTKTGYYLPFTPEEQGVDTIRWRIKYSKYFTIYIQVLTSEGVKYLQYYPSLIYIKHSERFRVHAIGNQFRDGKWHTITRNLSADLQDTYYNKRPDIKLLKIQAFLIRGTGQVDDIELLKKGSPESNKAMFHERMKYAEISNGYTSYSNNAPYMVTADGDMPGFGIILWAYSPELEDIVRVLWITSIQQKSNEDLVKFRKNNQEMIVYCWAKDEKTNRMIKVIRLYDISEPLKPKLISTKPEPQP